VEDLYIREEGTGAIASDIARTESVDDQRVQAIVNEIDGYDHGRAHRAATPGIFGMTFQAMAVEQKLPNGGGYLDGDGTPTPAVLSALKHTDDSIGRIVAELKQRNLLSSTLIIVTAVHGDSPYDRRIARNISEDLIPDMIGGDAVVAKAVADTEAFIWLKDQSQTARIAAMLMAPENRAKAAINEVVWGEALKLQFNDPLVDGRVPDLIVKPLVGVFYAGEASTKIAEHGGFYTEDVNVPLMLANPRFKGTVIKTPVPTTDVAPTILALLGLNPESLQSVRMEKTPILPGLR
jgi:arylsulfatase A-like enzyme